ncbi:hypothetical protein [Enterobacter sichuanensis]|uniref:hypothetical protein n=1 Tax=Enterobacter sichuanensis TaxID=2071710 RepID=UPI0012A9E0C4|nr:hypothetical protein [Enterobacter sichuanensis]QFQ08927.1 hypothetical protein C1N69_09565 [Enterobacter sichuanensis]
MHFVAAVMTERRKVKYASEMPIFEIAFLTSVKTGNFLVTLFIFSISRIREKCLLLRNSIFLRAYSGTGSLNRRYKKTADARVEWHGHCMEDIAEIFG